MDGGNKSKTSSTLRPWLEDRQKLRMDLCKQMSQKIYQTITQEIQPICALSHRKKESLTLWSQRTEIHIKESGSNLIRALEKLSWRNRRNSQSSYCHKTKLHRQQWLQLSLRMLKRNLMSLPYPPQVTRLIRLLPVTKLSRLCSRHNMSTKAT